MVSSVRLIIALILQLVAVLFSLGGWIDALEGGASVVMATAISAIAFIVGRVRIPKSTWIPALTAIALSITTIVLLLNTYVVTDPSEQSGEATVMSPVSPIVEGFNWAFRIAAIVNIAGAVFYLIQIFMAYRSSQKATGDK